MKAEQNLKGEHRTAHINIPQPIDGRQSVNAAPPSAKVPYMEWREYRPPQGEPVVTLRNVKARHAVDMPLVVDIDELAVYPGERIALIEPSSAGKTTLLRLLNGYIKPQSGQVNILGNRIDASASLGRNYRGFWPRDVRRRIGFVFQDFSLIERASVFENVLWGRLGRVNPLWSLLGRFSETDKQIAMAAIAEVDLLTQRTQRVDTLSGGQQQRVGVARVLAQEAEIILADEPVSNLDPALADDVLELLADVSGRRNAAMIMSLHQPLLAKKYADRIIGLRAGRIVYNGPAEEFDSHALGTIYNRPGYEHTIDIDTLSDSSRAAAELTQWQL